MRIGKTILFAAAALLSTIAAEAVTSDEQVSPYQAIVKQNVFHLSPPAITIVAPAPEPSALPKITLTGIMTILGRRMAFLTIAAIKPGQAAESFTVGEGQGVNHIEVKAIDEKAGVVSVLNHGELQILDFDHNGVKASDIRYDPPREQILPRPAAPPPGVHNETALTPEEQAALIEVQRVKYQQENNPIRAILPPTEMTTETHDNN